MFQLMLQFRFPCWESQKEKTNIFTSRNEPFHLLSKPQYPGKTCIIELHLCIFSFISVPVPNFLPLILLLPWALLLNSSSSPELQHCTMLNTFLSFVPLVAESRELHATVQQYTRWRHKLAAFLWRPLQLFALKEWLCNSTFRFGGCFPNFYFFELFEVPIDLNYDYFS